MQTDHPSQRGSSTHAAASARRPLSRAQAASCEHLPAISGGGGPSGSQQRARELLGPAPARPSFGEAATAVAATAPIAASEKRPHRSSHTADRTGVKWRTHLAPGFDARADGDSLDSLTTSGRSFGSDENSNDNETYSFARAPFHVVDRVKEEAAAAAATAHVPRRGSLTTADLRPTETAHSASINGRSSPDMALDYDTSSFAPVLVSSTGRR